MKKPHRALAPKIMNKLHRQVVSTLISGGRIHYISKRLIDLNGKEIRILTYRTIKAMERDGIICFDYYDNSYGLSDSFKNKLSDYSDPQ